MSHQAYRVHCHNHGFFRLDGGAMFGSVPKALWSKVAPPDDQNRILLATRSLIVEDGQRKLLIDLGCGDKWDDKNRSIFCIEDGRYAPVPNVTEVLITHLHFDHAGGVSRLGENGVVPNYTHARHWAPRPNLENARNPNVRERGSYLRENVDVLNHVDLKLLEDGDEVWPGITVHRSDGHTEGLFWVQIQANGETFAYPADLIPTSAHLPLPYVMGYDMCAQTSLKERAAFLEQAVARRWVVVFEHDPKVCAARLEFDERGRARITETIDL